MTVDRISARAWRDYDCQVQRRSSGEFSTGLSAEFDSRGVHFGQLDLSLAMTAATALEQSKCIFFNAGDFTPGFVTYDYSAEIVDGLNRTSVYRKLGARETWIIADVLDAMRQEVAQCLGTPWRTINVRAWSTLAQAELMGPYSWHDDGFVEQIFKIMIYLTPLSPESGGVEFQLDGAVIRHASASPGAWALFKNSTVKHRGVPGNCIDRMAVEVTICRSPNFETRPRYPGLNAHWPMFPRVEAVDGCCGEAARKVATDAVPLPRDWARHVTLSALKLGLYALVPVCVVAFAPVKSIAPGAAKRIEGLIRHARGRTMYLVAEHLTRKILGR